VTSVLFPANDDGASLRTLLEEWAADLCPDPKLQQTLVEATISAAASDPDRLDGLPVEVALFSVMRDLVRMDPCNAERQG